MSSPSSFTPLRKKPSSLRSHATSRIHGSGTETETDRWEDSLNSHPLSTSSPAAHVANLSHPYSSRPSTSSSAQRASMSSPRAHPYQLAAYSSNYRTAQDGNDTYTKPAASTSKEAPIQEMHEKPVLSPRTPNTSLPTNTLLSNGQEQEQQEQERRNHKRKAARRASLVSLRILNNYPVPSAPKTPRLGKSSIPQIVTFFSLALLLPVVLPVIYLPTGHAILKLAQQSNGESIYGLARILSSVKAGAAGGAILALPILLVLYLLGLFPSSVGGNSSPSSSPPTHQAGQDFFEDSDTDSVNQWSSAKLARFGSIALVALLILSIGGMTGPLGVTALSSSSGDPVQEARLGKIEVFLTPSTAAAAGMIGGCIVAGGSVAMVLLSAGMMMLFGSVDSQQLEV